MPLWWDKWLDQTIERLGYMKADRVRQVNVGALFAGEAPLVTDAMVNWSPDDWERLAITLSWIYSDVGLIARTFSRAKFKVLRQEAEDQTEIEAHPFELLLRRPNPYMGTSFLWQYTLQWLELRGEAYWWKVFDRTGQLVQIWPVPANRMAPIPDAQNYISGYSYAPRTGEPPITLSPGQVAFFRLPNPFDFHRGLSPLSACRLAMKTDQAAQNWNWNSFDQGAPLRMIVSVPETMSEPNFQRFKADIETEFKAGKQYLIARGGTVDAKQVGMTQEDLDFLAGRTFTREELDRVYGVPAGFWAKEATRANSEAAEAALVEYTVMPLHVLFAEEMTAQILPHYGEGLDGQFEDIRKEDRALVVQERTQYWQVLTVNEARQELGKKDLDDDELGNMLVPIAIRGQPAPAFGLPAGAANPPGVTPPALAPFAAAASGQVKPGEAVDEGEADPDELGLDKAGKADLRRWESIARRRLKAGERPETYPFESEHLPAGLKAVITAALVTAQTDEEVKAAFVAPFCRCQDLGWEGYP